MEGGNPEFDSLLSERWTEYFEKSKDPSDPAAKVYHEQSQFRDVDGKIVAFYNQRHVSI